MKKFLLSLAATMVLCLGVNAQKQYTMKVLKTDGTTIEFDVNDVKDVTFVNQQSEEPEVFAPHHFDLTVTVGKQGGMGRDVTTIMQSRETLDAGAVVPSHSRSGFLRRWRPVPPGRCRSPRPSRP